MKREHVISFFAIPFITSIVALLLSISLIYFINLYGFALFVAIPVFIGFFSSSLLCMNHSNNMNSNVGIGCLSGLFISFFLLLFGYEGVICILMSLPLSIPLIIAGSFLGTLLCKRTSPKILIIISLLLIPVLTVIELIIDKPAPTRPVTTSVIINGSIDVVWNTVIAFPEIIDEPSGILKYGIAYPIRASIVGEGTEAIRYCEFNTGSFVEPITVWEEPTHLAFDVTEYPLPMTELSIYDYVDPPHLHGFMVSEKGEFRLREREDGKVMLTGTTWYHHDLHPQFYWRIYSEYIIHQIHLRVLNHIKNTVENKQSPKEQ